MRNPRKRTCGDVGRFVKYEACPACRRRGRDRRGDNMGRYDDGSGHCFSCGHHEFPKGLVPKYEVKHDKEEGALPRDFTRDVPADGWKWLLQYGLPYSYWKPYTGYSPSTERLVLTHGTPVELSVGRFIGTPSSGGVLPQLREGEIGSPPAVPRKWRQWGDKLRSASILDPTDSGEAERLVVLVEDLVSAHKVRAAGFSCLPLFGTVLYPKALQVLRALKQPVVLWLDEDQYSLLPPKLNRLQTFLDLPVRFVKTEKDPKQYSLDEIKEILIGAT